jgi:rsbT co-antagonist protein RsbR
MPKAESGALPSILEQNESEILGEWVEHQRSGLHSGTGAMSDGELRAQSMRFLTLLRATLQDSGGENISTESWSEVRDYLTDVSRSRAKQGFTPSEIASFIFSLKQPLFSQLRRSLAHDGPALADETWRASVLLDNLGLFTFESYQESREQLIRRQQQEMLELSTPVVQLWDKVLALPLIGTLDSSRTQIVMETLLERIVETEASIAIIDITGVPTVDTLVAQHLLKAVAAARLMGADCIISGIRPQIAQTIVHLGVELGDVATKATLADAFALALQRTGSALNRSPRNA